MPEDGYFDERVAVRYDEDAAEMFDSAVVDPVVDLLVAMAEGGRVLELGIQVACSATSPPISSRAGACRRGGRS